MKAEKISGIWFMLSVIVYLLGLPICFLAAPLEFSLGYAAGGALVLVNSWMSARSVKRAPFPNKGKVMASILGGFYLRIILLGLCLFGFIKFVHVDPLGLVTGLSVVPASLLCMLILIYIANRRPEEV